MLLWFDLFFSVVSCLPALGFFVSSRVYIVLRCCAVVVVRFVLRRGCEGEEGGEGSRG